MTTYQLNVNGRARAVTVDPSTPLLWVLREDLKMTGTKYGKVTVFRNSPRSRADLRTVSNLGRSTATRSRNFVRRRTTDVRDRPGYHESAEAADDR
jgi:hypothetical protein